MSAAATHTVQAATCNARIIVGLAQARQPPPSDQWVGSLAAANGVQLQYVRAITARLYLFRLSVAGADANCRAPIARLRRDSRLRSVELDQRRKHDAS